MDTWSLASDYLTAKRAGWAKATLDNRVAHLKAFAHACPTLPTTPEPIEAFLGDVAHPGYRYNTWCTVRLLYRWLAKRRGVVDPCDLVEAPRKPDPTPYWLEQDELAQLLGHPHRPRDRALLWLLADTGMRRGEAHSMTVEAMKDNPDGSGWLHVTGKSGPRWVPVSAHVWAMLRAIAPASGPFWRSVYGRHEPMSVGGLGFAVWLAFQRAGLRGDKMSSHRLRHTFATMWGGSDGDGMDILGHRDYQTWRIYKHMRPQRLAEAHSLHSPLASMLPVPLSVLGLEASPALPVPPIGPDVRVE